MNDYVLKTDTDTKTPSNEIVWAFDLGKGSIGEAVRRETEFLHKASLLIPAEFLKIKMGLFRLRGSPVWKSSFNLAASGLALPNH